MNYCPKCAGILTGRATEWWLGHCTACRKDVVIRLVDKSRLTISMKDLHLDYLTKRVAELEFEKERK